MSTKYILEKLKEIESLEARRTETVRLFKCFYDSIPTSGFNPAVCMDNLDDADVRKCDVWGEKFYEQILDLCEGSLPIEIQKLNDEFKVNRTRTEELLNLSREDRRKLETHELFPYWSKFDNTVHELFNNYYGSWHNIDLEKITFLPQIIAKGGFATIYAAEDIDKRKYALKLFHPLSRFPIGLGDRNARERSCAQIAKNLNANKELVSLEPFASLKAFPYVKSQYDPIKCYLMDFIQGQTVRDSLENNIKLSPDSIGRIFLTYAKMLDSIHAQNKLFVDNNWGAVIANNDEARICDYDFITSIENVSEDKFHVHELRYGSQEHYLREGLNPVSDLESFALMIDHLLVGDSLIGADWKEGTKNETAAKENKRKYLKERRTKLPRQLKKIIPRIISYPRDNSITAKDFVEAIKQDYQV